MRRIVLGLAITLACWLTPSAKAQWPQYRSAIPTAGCSATITWSGYSKVYHECDVYGFTWFSPLIPGPVFEATASIGGSCTISVKTFGSYVFQWDEIEAAVFAIAGSALLVDWETIDRFGGTQTAPPDLLIC